MVSRTARSRLTIDVPFDLKRRLRVMAAHRDVTLREYVVASIEERLAADWTDLAEEEGLLALTAQTDPVLAELWDNEKDAAYDAI